MLDPTIKIDNIASATGFDPATLLSTSNKQITYHIGHYGPFQQIIRSADYTAEKIAEILNAHAKTLRDLGTPGV